MGDSSASGSSLSVCCLTRGPTARVAAQLALLRAVADEVVVGLDTSVDEALAHPLADVADVLVRYPFLDPVDRPVGWIHSLCTRDWILWIDDDEIPSTGLVASIREVIAEGSVTHCFVPRRTLWRDAETALAGPPWVPDFQLRLVLNDPRLVWFPGITHWPIQALGPHRYLETPLYHTDLLLTSETARRAKVRRYEAAIPGRRVAGLPMNDAYFLPEDRASLELTRVAEPDRDVLSRILALDPWPEPRVVAPPPRVATRQEIDRHWHAAPATDELYRGTVDVVTGLEPFVVGEQRGVVLRIENRGSHTWPQDGVGWPSVAVAYHWVDETGQQVGGDGLRTRLPASLQPGRSLLMSADVLAPPLPGSYTLVLDLIHEHVRWFGLDVERHVDVRASLTVALLGEDDQSARLAAAALAEHAPDVRPLVLTASPAAIRELHGYGAGQDARGYVLGHGRRGVRGAAGAVGRAGALLGDAALRRAGRRSRLASDGGVAFLDALTDADALVVVGDARLRGDRGEREALQQLSAVMAASTLGLAVVIVSTAERDRRTGTLAARVFDTVPVGDEGFALAIRAAVDRVRART